MTDLKLEEYYGEPNNKMVRLPAAIPEYAVQQKANIHASKEKDYLVIEIIQINPDGKAYQIPYGVKVEELRQAINLLDNWQKGK